MSKTAYIAGKVMALPGQQLTDKFNVVASQLSDMGYNVVKPSTDNTWHNAMRDNIVKMLECDEVHMLPDWQESRGARLERDIALRIGMQVVYH